MQQREINLSLCFPKTGIFFLRWAVKHRNLICIYTPFFVEAAGTPHNHKVELHPLKWILKSCSGIEYWGETKDTCTLIQFVFGKVFELCSTQIITLYFIWITNSWCKRDHYDARWRWMKGDARWKEGNPVYVIWKLALACLSGMHCPVNCEKCNEHCPISALFSSFGFCAGKKTTMWTKLNLFWDFNPLNLDGTYQTVIDKLGVKLRLLNRKLFWDGTSCVSYQLEKEQG